MDKTYITPNTLDKDIENTEINNNVMNEQTSTSQVTNGSKDAKVSEYLNSISTFIKKMESAVQVGGGNAIVSTERTKVAKLLNVLSIDELLSQLQSTSTDVSNTKTQQ